MPWYNPTDPKQRNAGVVGLVLIAMVYPYNRFYHSGHTEALAVLQDSLESLETVNLTAQVLAARGGGRIEETMAEYERQAAKLEELIPAGEEVAGLMQDISLQSRIANVRVNDLTPEVPESVGGYELRATQMSVIGEYHDVARFLAAIANLPRIVTPLQLSVEVYSSPEQFPQYEAPVIADFRIETYVLLESSAPPPAGVEGVS